MLEMPVRGNDFISRCGTYLMDKEVRTAITGYNKAIPLHRVEPFDLSCTTNSASEMTEFDVAYDAGSISQRIAKFQIYNRESPSEGDNFIAIAVAHC